MNIVDEYDDTGLDADTSDLVEFDDMDDLPPPSEPLEPVVEPSDDIDNNITYDEEDVKANYFVPNKDLLREIHRSKTSFCEFEKPEYHQYDLILDFTGRDIDHEEVLTPENIDSAKIRKAKRLSSEAYASKLAAYNLTKTGDKPRAIDSRVMPSSITDDGLIFRINTYEHIPLSPGRKKTPKRTADYHAKLNFVPFKHFILEAGQLREVGLSHRSDGVFSTTGGRLTEELGRMINKMVNKYGERGNWRMYSYNEEMRSFASYQLCETALKFNEFKSDLAFSYYTDCISNSFTRIFHTEKRSQNLRDDLLIQRGESPSFTRQLEHEERTRLLREAAMEAAKKS